LARPRPNWRRVIRRGLQFPESELALQTCASGVLPMDVRRLKTARREKKNQRATASTDIAPYARPSSNSSTITFRLLYCLVILRHGRRLWVSFGVTTNPTAEWISRQITEAFPWDSAPRYLIRDRDTAYGPAFVQRLRAMGIRDRPIAPRSPWQNPYVERLIGTIRRECLDHMIVFGRRTCAGSWTSMPLIMMNRAFMARWTRMPHSIGRLSISASSHHGLSLAAFITNIAESDFRHAHYPRSN
jgi:transposase InsO family protein